MPVADATHDRFDIRLLPRTEDDGEGRELPMRILVLGAFSGHARPTGRLETRKPVAAGDASFAQVMAGLRPRLLLTIDDGLAGSGAMTIALEFADLHAFSPEAVMRAVPAAAALLETRTGLVTLLAAIREVPGMEGLLRTGAAEPGRIASLLEANGAPATAQRGLASAMRAAATGGDPAALLSRPGLAGLIAEIDRRLSALADAILHHPDFRALEALWRGLTRLTAHADGRGGVLVDLLDVSKDEMREDFEDASDIVRSGLFQVAYTGEYGQHGGQPYALLVTDWAFASSPPDLMLLGRMAAVAAMAHAPLLATADPALLGLRSFAHLEDLHDLASLLAGPAYAKWRAFRASEDARYVGLVLPGILLRTPWGEGASGTPSFEYHEGGDGRLWGGGACALAARMAASFARWRWCAEAVGPVSGTIENLPLQAFAAARGIESRLPIESWISEARSALFAEEGLIAIASLRGTGACTLLSAPGCHMPATFGRDQAGRDAAISERLGAQLPWLMLACRFAHCLKVMQRERIGSATSREDLERELGDWLRNHVVDMDTTDAATRQSSPLRAARLRVEDVPGASGWYRINLSITPHVRHLGTSFSLAVVGRLDRPGVATR